MTTEAGLRRAVTLVESVGTVTIRVEGASGRLIGPLVVDTVEIEHPRASIRIAGLEADYEPLEIARRPDLRGRRDGRARRPSRCARRPARHARRRSCRDGSRSPSTMPSSVTFSIVAPSGTETRFRDIRGSARITRSSIEFKGVHARSTGWAVAGASGTLFAREPLALDVTTAWSLTDDERVAGVVHATGDLDGACSSTPGWRRRHGPRPGRGPRPHHAADVSRRGRGRVARPRAVDRKSARRPARGVARNRGRSPPLCRRAARCAARACRRPASGSMRAQAMRTRS